MLRSLERATGLPLSFDPETATLRWPAEVHVEETSVRTFREMVPLLADPDARSDRETIYTVYRNVCRAGDLATMQATSLRYDITIIPPGSFVGKKSKEFFKTAGHYHPEKARTGVRYPEVYEVLVGRAYWLIQRPEPTDRDRIAEVYLIEGGPGEKAIIPPGFGHVAINAYPEPLVLANWVSTTFTYDYDAYRSRQGAAYWACAGPEPESVVFDPNPRYRAVPDLRKLAPKEFPAFGLVREKHLYDLIRDFAKLRFLSNPEDFVHLLTLEHCYETLGRGYA